MDTRQRPEPKFELGRVVATPAALRAIEAAHEVSATFLYRHERGDWGELDEDDKRCNARALINGGRIFSVYNLPITDERLWIITEAEGDDGKRASTCVLLPDDY
jgi:hypothetical protein